MDDLYLEKTKLLIKNNDFSGAIQNLERSYLNQKGVELLSNLYRMEYRFEDEKKLISRAKPYFPNWHYLQEREEWHARPLFHVDPAKSKVVPRPPLHLERDPAYIPSQETLDNLCFVTGADSNYFSLMWEMIESLKATRYYKDIPINIIDCGLTDEEKHLLQPHLSGGIIKDPGWLVEIDSVQKYDWRNNVLENFQPVPNYFKGVILKPFLDQIFPKFEYYFWMNPNCWVQDGNALDYFFYKCKKRKMAISVASEREWKYKIQNHPILSKIHVNFANETYKDLILDQLHPCDAVFCAHQYFFKNWKYLLYEHLKNNNFFYNLNELLIVINMSQENNREFVSLDYFSGYTVFYIKDESPGILYVCGRGKAAGIIRAYGYFNTDCIEERMISTRYRYFNDLETFKRILG